MKKHILKVWMILAISFLAVDVVGQGYSPGFPNVSDETYESATLKVSATVGGTVNTEIIIPGVGKFPITYATHKAKYITLLTSDPEPSVDNVIFWSSDGNGGSISDGFYGSIDLWNANTQFSSNITNLQPDANYIVYLVTVDTNENPVIQSEIDNDAPTAVSFITESEPVVVDPPVIIEDGYLPLSNSYEISRNPVLELTFNENIVKGNSGYFRIFESVGDDELLAIPRSNGQVSVLGNKLTVSLSNITLAFGTKYYILIDPGFVKSAASSGVDFGGISSPLEWFFTTESAPPEWVATFPFISDQNQSSFTINAWADMIGTYYGVVTTNPVPPTIDNIKSGSNARISFNEVVNSIATASSKVVDFNFLTPTGYDYFLHVVYANVEGNKNSEVRTLSIDRKAPDLLITNPIEGRITFPVDSVLTISFDEPAFAVDGTNLTAAHFSLVKVGTPDEVISFSFNVATESEITTVVLDPVVDLDENSKFLLVISPVYDLSGNISIQEEINFETDGLSTWTGGGNSSSWIDENNWDGDGYAQYKSVLIPYGLAYYPEISTGTVDVHNLTIEPGAVLTHSGGTLNVKGMFTLQSSVNFNASYIHNGAVGTVLNEVGSNVRVEQFINNIDLTYLISSPTDGSSAANFGNYYPLSIYNNTTDSWDAVSSGAVMDPGVGYRMWTDDSMVSFSGKINTGGFQVNLTRTNGQGFGWNLVGNPYPASIDWEQMGITESSTIEDNFWFWLPTLRSYGAYSASTSIPINIESPIIPSNHAFLVKVKIDEPIGNIEFMPSAQVPNDNNYLKSASNTKPVVDYIKLAGIAPNNIKDEMAVAFVDEASTGHDRFDLEKRFANRDHLLELFSFAGSMKTAINSFPLDGVYEIPLGFNALKTGDFAIEMVVNNAEYVETVLVDKEDATEVRLLPGERYDFSVNTKGLNTSRFILKFLKVSTDFGSESSDFVKSSIFVQNKEVFVNSSTEAVGSEYRVYDFSGRFIRSGLIGSAGLNSLGYFVNGTYIISVNSISSANLENHKVVVY